MQALQQGRPLRKGVLAATPSKGHHILVSSPEYRGLEVEYRSDDDYYGYSYEEDWQCFMTERLVLTRSR